MSSAKKATAAKKNSKKAKQPVKAGDAVSRSEALAVSGQQASVPAKSASRVPAKREAQLPMLHESKAPARRENRTPVEVAPDANPYLPDVATVVERIQETAEIVTLRLVLDDPAKMKRFTFKPGQVGQLSVFGAGEATFVINSPPSQRDYLQMSIMRAGEATSAIHKLAAGAKVGLRAPLGNFFPYAQWKGKDVFFVGGGIGMAPIRTIMLHLFDNRQEYGNLSLLYGARSPQHMAYSYEVDSWLTSGHLDVTLTIDAPSEGWKHKVGLIPNVLLELAPNPKNCVAVVCGPPIMIKFTLQALQKLAFPSEQIVTTLEKRMKCGIGICGRCNIGHTYVCVDGPVFSLAELKELPDEL